MRVLVVNAGSSSLKLAVVDAGLLAERPAPLAATVVERWGGRDHLGPLEEFLAGVGRVDAVGHRAVHGAARTGAVLLDDAVVAELEGLAELAPLHQPPGVAAMRAVSRLLPDTPAVACFDTAFHAGMPAAAATYAVPREWNARFGLRRYGFHGLSHAWAARRGAGLAGLDPATARTVTCHLGAGASLAAVRAGRSVDTTMGFTPLEGLAMVTRSGSVDPGMLLWLLESGRLDLPALTAGLQRGGGLAGLSGTSGDLRDVQAARDAGDPDAQLAYAVFVHRLAREAAGMVVGAGGLDLLVLTGGIGEHAPGVRADLAAALAHLGVSVDPARNAAAHADADVSADGAAVRTVVVAAREDLEIVRQVAELLGGPAGKQP